MGQCIHNIFQLLSIYKDNPNHLWNLLNLLAQILRVLSNDALMKNMPFIMQSMNSLIEMKDNKGMIISGIAEMMEGILDMMDPEKTQYLDILISMCQLSLKHLEINLSVTNRNKSIEDEDKSDSLYRLWLALMKAYSPQILSND